MSTATETTTHGKFDEIAGKVKQGVGEAINDQDMANRGAAQQVKGHTEQAWGSVKQGAADLANQHSATEQQHAHDARESVTSTAQNVKEHIQAGIDNLRNK